MAVPALPRGVRAVAVALLLVVVAAPAASQTVLDPTLAEFDPSPDHNTLVSGTPIVSHYRLSLYAIGSSTAFTTANLGKPAPDPDGKIRVSLAGLFTVTPVPGVSYEARISAVGPGGTSGVASSNTFVFSATCAPSLTLVGQTLPAAGGSGSVDVAAGAGCSWSATSSAAWLTFLSGASGSGSGTVTFSAASNTGTSPRMASISIAGQTFTVTQASASSSCSYALSPTSQAIAAPGGAGTASIATAGGCSWTAASGAAWLTITGGASGSGAGTIAFAASANPTTSPRSGTITAAGRTLTVTQAAASCTYAISPGGQTVSAAGGTGTVSVSTMSGCSWTAASSVAWIKITEGASASGPRSFGFSVAANTTSSVRTGTISVGGQTFTVTQKAHGLIPPSGLRVKGQIKGQ